MSFEIHNKIKETIKQDKLQLVIFICLLVLLPITGSVFHRLGETELFLLILLSSHHFTHCHQEAAPRGYLCISLINYAVTMFVYSFFQTNTNLILAIIMHILYLLFIIRFSKDDILWTLLWDMIAVQFYFYKPEYGYIIAITMSSSMLIMMIVMIFYPNNFHHGFKSK